ncbi:MAG: hypothetical protein V3S69_02590 [Dehalococcoidales bacterium]
MSENITGLVKKLTSKEVGAKKSTAYSICLTCDDNGEDEWFGHGFDAPQCYEGDKIAFEVEYKGDYANIVVTSLVITEEGAGGAEPEPTPPARRGRAAPASKPAGRASRGAKPAAAPARRGAKPAAAAAPAGRTRAKPASGGVTKDQYWENKEKRDIARDLIIQLQSAQNTAIATINAAIAAGALPLPAKKSADKFDALLACIDDEASRLREVYLAGGHDSTVIAGSTGEGEYDDDGGIPE